MESEQRAYLPPELLSIISGFLHDAADIIRFRSVCRSWRLSTPMLHKISPFFPLVLPADVHTISGRLTEIKIQASALYLLRSRRLPSKAWVVHAQEYAPGKLFFRHAMNLKEIPVANWPDLSSSSDEWSSVTQIARTYTAECQGVSPEIKFAQIISKSPGFNILVRSNDPCISWSSVFAHVTTATVGNWCYPSVGCIGDFVQFNGQMYAVDDAAALFMLDDTASTPEFTQLIPGLTIPAPIGVPCWDIRKRLAVLDEHLYMVLSKDTLADSSFQFLECYILVVEEEEECEARWERVEDLGGGVLFINQHYTFALSAKDLPPPWMGRGNSIVYLRYPSVDCSHPTSMCWGIWVFQLGVEAVKFTADPPFSFFQCYPDLFDPPLV